ncbi:LysR substrate-binding domain-containing protein [Burkholderia sp. AU45388]|uniref:LysR substrate-binding domain-containing protein n=1 Tax=Burkholderia sp. AU45388 TaxID=3059206 RepID=UPI0026535EEF|nr:LysR substrate-binding domain-containing protein [Burkholderia sp. AU45388]MDN7430709.1 LysR substrate-binding domain-containing protein [Burkholderia sp. AU45388]
MAIGHVRTWRSERTAERNGRARPTCGRRRARLRSMRFTDANALIDAALQGRGVALARRSLIEPELADGTLVRVSTVRIADVYAHYVVWRPDHPHEAAIRAWLDWLRSEVRRRTPRR